MVNWLTKETGMSKDHLLTGLSKYLPEAIDKLTGGKVPTTQEAQQHVNQQRMH
ncbi:MAG TPA: YidB family protein [Micropepsaceae bacterium]|nr:YidB family protein [Micropepsaceae bacterium]